MFKPFFNLWFFLCRYIFYIVKYFFVVICENSTRNNRDEIDVFVLPVHTVPVHTVLVLIIFLKDFFFLFMKILPAMCDRRTCIWCIHRNNSSKELEEWSWMFWYAMIGPSCILKLFYLSSVRVSHLFSWIKIQNYSKMLQKYVAYF